MFFHPFRSCNIVPTNRSGKLIGKDVKRLVARIVSKEKGEEQKQ